MNENEIMYLLSLINLLGLMLNIACFTFIIINFSIASLHCWFRSFLIRDVGRLASYQY